MVVGTGRYSIENGRVLQHPTGVGANRHGNPRRAHPRRYRHGNRPLRCPRQTDERRYSIAFTRTRSEATGSRFPYRLGGYRLVLRLRSLNGLSRQCIRTVEGFYQGVKSGKSVESILTPLYLPLACSPHPSSGFELEQSVWNQLPVDSVLLLSATLNHRS